MNQGVAATTGTAAGGTASRTPVHSWQVASSATVGDDGSRISLPGYDARRWMRAPARSTVLAALVANGEYPDIFYSTRMRDEVDPARFAVPWWFRSVLTIPEGGGRTRLRVGGVIPRADLWVNGHRLRSSSDLAGAYVATAVDVTDVVHPGFNALALLVHPGNPMEDLSIGWVDWSQSPPDHNMGPWRDVVVERTGDVRLGRPSVVTVPADEHGGGAAGAAGSRSGASGSARLRIVVEATNDGPVERTVGIATSVAGHGANLAMRHEVTLSPGSTTTLRLGGDDDPVVLPDAAWWWPVGEGSQPLYRLTTTATVEGTLSDHVESTFGVRTVDSEICPGGGRRFRVNGRPVQVLGGGWSPDLLLRNDDRRLADQLALTVHMGLNTIRPEGKLENPEFYDLCDRMGIMVLPGWECCNKWEAAAGTGGAVWNEHDAEVAVRSMESEAEVLRSHPCVIGFLIGSDFAPPDAVASRYVEALGAKGWDLPIVASATVEGTPSAGPSGMKMTGPYDWVAPVYWYDRDPELGGAVGFNSETSAGHTIPRLPSLRRTLAPSEIDQLWQMPHLRQYHSGPPSVFDNLAIFARALSERYGEPKDAEDFVAKAQLAAYENVRAQFEAFILRDAAPEPATGVVYWMLSAPWPSLNWQLFDYFLDTPGSYAGARKALERLHPLYAYDTGSVHVVNRSGDPAGDLSLGVRRWRVDGGLVDERHHEIESMAAGTIVEFGAVEPPDGVDGAWFLELELGRSGIGTSHDDPSAGSARGPERSRNVYWISSAGDVLDRETATWHSTGTARFADLRALDEIRRSAVRARAGTQVEGDELVVTLTVQHDDPPGTPAVALHASIVAGSDPVAPVRWDDNDVTLFVGQSTVLTGRLALPGDPDHRPIMVRLDGFNLYRPVLLPV